MNASGVPLVFAGALSLGFREQFYNHQINWGLRRSYNFQVVKQGMSLLSLGPTIFGPTNEYLRRETPG